MTSSKQSKADLAAQCYTERWPERPPLNPVGMLTGVWMIGSCYKNPNKLYGAYPYGYLDRVHTLFPKAKTVLHAFSGGLTIEAAKECALPGVEFELVDLKGPEDGRHPTYQCSVLNLPASWKGRFDLVLADPPYSTDDAEKYGTPMPSRAEVCKSLRRVTKKGGDLVWLDQVWPMHSKLDWKLWGTIGLVRSTNHRVRLVSIFEAV